METHSMKRMVISEPTKITLNGLSFLFEPGDKISIKGREEIIKEGLEKLGKLKEIQKELYKRQSDVEVKIRSVESESNSSASPDLDNKIKRLLKQKNQIDLTLQKIKSQIAIESGELEKLGYDKAKRLEFVRNFIKGNEEEAEAEEKEKRKGEISVTRDKIEEKMSELEQAKADKDEYAREQGYKVIDGEYYSPSGDDYEPLTADEAEDLEDKFSHIGKLESEIEQLEKLGMAQEVERDEEGTDGELDTGIPELTHRVITQDELDTLPTTDDPYDDPAGTAIGDRISEWLIEGGFQPKELGTFSQMLQSLEEIEAA